jgi:tetratricopeptide (TPR) repeat protein
MPRSTADDLLRGINLAITLEVHGHKARAARQYEAVLELLADHSAHSIAGVARLLRTRKRHGQAVRAFRQALRKSPEDVGLWMELAATLRAGGQVERAASVIKGRFCVLPNSSTLLSAVADATASHRLTGDREEIWLLRRLACEVDLPSVHLRLARIRLPGPGYLRVLEAAHRALEPRSYLEIGVASGASLSLVRPPTIAIGVDPSPTIRRRLRVQATVYQMESDAFFRDTSLGSQLAGRPFGLAFIDGLHTFEQALRDFVNVEACAAPGSVVLIHDCLPLDERTASLPRRTSFWSGDTWKLVPYLLDERPDLCVRLIPCAPTGLLVVSGLKPKPGRASPADARIERYSRVPLSELRQHYLGRITMIENTTEAHRALFASLGNAARGEDAYRPSSPRPALDWQ